MDTNFPRTYENGIWGQDAEQIAAYTYTGEIRAHDNVPFDKGSDIPELNMSVKAGKFTLASANLVKGETVEEQLEDFMGRVHSTSFAYICKSNYTAYVMDRNEFRLFVTTFCSMTRESEKNGGGMKVKCKGESKKMVKWFEERVA